MDCYDSYQNEEPAVSECSECGSPVGKSGGTTRRCCNYSLFVCGTCGWAPCYRICKERKDAVHGATGAVALGIAVEDELWWRKMRDKMGVGAPGVLVTREVQLTKHEIEAAVAYYIEHSRNMHEE